MELDISLCQSLSYVHKQAMAAKAAEQHLQCMVEVGGKMTSSAFFYFVGVGALSARAKEFFLLFSRLLPSSGLRVSRTCPHLLPEFGAFRLTFKRRVERTSTRLNWDVKKAQTQQVPQKDPDTHLHLPHSTSFIQPTPKPPKSWLSIISTFI